MSVQQALDTFVRANQSGWGTASDGSDTWTARDATATYSILSNQGKILQNSTSVDEINTIGTPGTNVPYEIYGQCTTSNATSHPGLCVNFQSTGNMIKCEISPTAVQIVRYISGSQTTLKSDTSLKVTASNQTYNFRFRWEVGGTYYFKCWIGTNAEPAAWNCNAISDTTYNNGAVGIYLAPRGATTDTCLWNQFYASYSDLYEDTSVNSLSLTDSPSTFTLVDTPSTDALSAPAETAAYVVNPAPTESVTNAEGVTFGLAETLAADSLTSTDASVTLVTQTQSDALSAPTDAQAWVIADVPTESVTNTESVTFELVETIAVDALSSLAETQNTSVAQSQTDVLTSAETTAYALAESLLETALNEAETALYGVTDTLPTEAVTTSENSSYALAEALPSDSLTLAETDQSDAYFSVEENMVASEAVIEVLIETPASDSVALSETPTYKLAASTPIDSVTQTEVTLTVVTQTDSTTIGTPDESMVFGQPGVIFPDQLTIIETLDVSSGPPLVDVALFPSDRLDWDTNFTDHCDIEESVTFNYASSLLDARSVLYSNTISDGPSAYYQLNEDTFGGIFQRDGSDQPNNASIPILYGAMLQYTWAQIEPQETNRLFATIDNDILPWKNQAKKVILRVCVASTPFYNSTHNANTAGQATPSWVFDAGAPSVTGLDGAIYPVYWNATFLEKYQNFIAALANYYDENSSVAGIVIACGVNGTTSLEASGDTPSHTTALWAARGYTSAQWISGILDIINIYQTAFQHTPLILSVNDAVIVPDTVFNIHQCISLAVAEGVWLMDENVYINEQHNDPNWNIVPLVTVPQHSVASGLTPDTLDGALTLAINYQADYAAVWAADITLANEGILAQYFALTQTKGLNDSAASNFKMAIYGGVYPTSHISTGDYLNGAQQFDGLTGYGYIGQLAQTTTSAWTLKCTIFPTILPMDEAIAFSVGNDGSTGYGGYAIGISNGSSGGTGAKFCAHLPGVGWLDSGYSLPQVGQWYSLFVSWDGVVLRFYANGAQTPNTYETAALTPSLAMTIGAQWDGMTRTAKRFFIGSVDECAAYPFALDPTRILALSDIELGQDEILAGSGSSFNLVELLTVDDTSSTSNETLLVSDTLTLAETFTYSVASSNVNGYATLGSDQFNRLLTNSFGSATDGNTWQVEAGSSTLSVDGNVGQLTGSTSTNIVLLGASNTLEDVSCMVSLSATGDTIGVVAFCTTASNFYSLRYTATLQLYKTVSGVDTALGSSAAFTASANTWYHLHLKVSEGVLYGNIWLDGTAEPEDWMVTTADTSLVAGAAGVYIKSATSQHVVSLDNFFALDNILSDFLFLQEHYTLTAILPPLVDTLNAPVDSSTLTLENAGPDGTQLSVNETVTPTDEATGVDFLNLGASTQQWEVTLAPLEQLTEQEVLATPVVIDIPADAAPPVSDLITPYITPVTVDYLVPDETLFEAYRANLTDTPTLLDASTFTQARSIVDTDPSTRYIVRAFGGVIRVTKLTPLLASDKLKPTDNPRETSTLSMSDSVSHGPAYIFTESVTLVEAISFTTSNTLPTDVTPAPTDLVTSTMVPVPVDTLAETEQVTYSQGPLLPADVTGSVLEEDVTILVVQLDEDDTGNTEENVTDGPVLLVDDTLFPADTLLVTGVYQPEDDTSNTEQLVTSGLVTLPTDLVTTSDVVTPTNGPVLLDTLFPADTLSQVVLSQPLADTPIETESLVTIDIINNTLVQLGIAEDVTYTVLPLESNVFTEQEDYSLPLAGAFTDAVISAETALPGGEQTSLDQVNVEEQAIASNAIFDGSDANVFDEELFEQEYVYTTDSTVSSDSVIAIETFVHFLPDQPTEASDSVLFTNSFVPVDVLTESEEESAIFEVTLADIPALASDLISDLQANSFTGWVDLLSNSEAVAYVVSDIPVEVLTLLEGVLYSASDVYQDFSTPLAEVNSLTVEQDSADSNTQSEIALVSVTLPVTEQVTLLDTSTTTSVTLESTTLDVTETSTSATSTSTSETLVQVDASTVTCTTNDVTTLVQAESYIVTPVTLESNSFVSIEIVTSETVTSDSVTLSVADTSSVTGVTAPTDVTSSDETLACDMGQDDVTTLLLLDVTTTTSVTLESNLLQADETTLYVTGLTPITVTPVHETMQVAGSNILDDTGLQAQEISATGYTLLDTALTIGETVAIIRQSYIKTFGVIRTGQVDGIIRTGTTTGVMRTGLVDGVLS